MARETLELSVTRQAERQHVLERRMAAARTPGEREELAVLRRNEACLKSLRGFDEAAEAEDERGRRRLWVEYRRGGAASEGRGRHHVIGGYADVGASEAGRPKWRSVSLGCQREVRLLLARAVLLRCGHGEQPAQRGASAGATRHVVRAASFGGDGEGGDGLGEGSDGEGEGGGGDGEGGGGDGEGGGELGKGVAAGWAGAAAARARAASVSPLFTDGGGSGGGSGGNGGSGGGGDGEGWRRAGRGQRRRGRGRGRRGRGRGRRW